jgi:ABC-type uncharacterized transport system YnjBCD ATPase subunit
MAMAVVLLVVCAASMFLVDRLQLSFNIKERRASMLEISRIRKHYDGQLLLDDISFSVGESETVCLLGPSGGGKSTCCALCRVGGNGKRARALGRAGHFQRACAQPPLRLDVPGLRPLPAHERQPEYRFRAAHAER